MVSGYRFFLFLAATVLTSGSLSSHLICVSVLLQFHCLFFLPCCSSSPSSSNKIKSTISAISPPHTLRRVGQLFFPSLSTQLSRSLLCIPFFSFLSASYLLQWQSIGSRSVWSVEEKRWKKTPTKCATTAKNLLTRAIKVNWGGSADLEG